MISAALNRFIQFRAGLFNLTITNVPGPSAPLYFGGRPMRQILGSAPLAKRHAATIAAVSYNGTMFLSITTDPARLPEGGTLVDDLRAEFAADADVGEALCERYLERLAGGSSASELTATLRAYLACDVHVERTAERLFVHQNTVRYRLARFEELAGASLREPEVAIRTAPMWHTIDILCLVRASS